MSTTSTFTSTMTSGVISDATSPTLTKVLVTGAASGLGRTFLEHYATLPNHAVAGIDARPWPQTDVLPASARFVQVDVTDELSVKAFLSTCDGKDEHSSHTGDDGAAAQRSTWLSTAPASEGSCPLWRTPTRMMSPRRRPWR